MFVVKTTDGRAEACVRELREKGIPVASVPVSPVAAVLFDSVGVVFQDPNTALAVLDLLPGLRVILCGDRFCRHPDVVQVPDGEGVTERILQAANEILGGDPAFRHIPGVVFFAEDGPWCCGERLFLTNQEELVLRCLATFRETFLPPAFLSAYCGCSVGSVPVHISRINEKAFLRIEREIVECRRGLGYRIRNHQTK